MIETSLMAKLPIVYHSGPVQPPHYCWCCTNLPVDLTLHFTLTREQNPEILELPHSGRWLTPNQEGAIISFLAENNGQTQVILCLYIRLCKDQMAHRDGHGTTYSYSTPTRQGSLVIIWNLTLFSLSLNTTCNCACSFPGMAFWDN